MRTIQIRAEALREVEEALERYEAEVQASRLSASAKETYLGHTRHFVRWLKGDFVPGGTLGPRRTSGPPR